MQIPIRGVPRRTSRYQPLGLRDMPFPTQPVSDPYNQDPRRNGTIYAVEPVRESIEQFERLLIRPSDFENRARLAYLWSRGDQETGRGMGKTALLRYFRQRINQDWGATEYAGRFSSLVVYVSFPHQVDRRYMEQLALSALVDICKTEVLDASRVVLRVDEIPADTVKAIVANPDGTEEYAHILNDTRLEEHGVEVAAIDSEVTQRLVDAGIPSRSAAAFSKGTFEDYLKSFRRDGNLEPLYVPRDTKVLDYARDLLFNQVVLYLREAGFAGGYLFIDDIENLVDQMARRHRIEFAKEFALCTVRPGYANSTYNFFSCVLTTHQQASVGLATAWGEAGLSGIARLDPNDPSSVELPSPSPEQARAIVVAHLDHYREDSSEMGSVKPFTEDGMAELLRNVQSPRVFLTAASTVITHAADQGLKSIDAACVRSAIREGQGTPSVDYTEGIEGAT